ncbi:methylenetetrahydrofolate reductase [Desulfatitalea alkaliphila]|uniref:Methylenetetrahydrofolate reductase n=1 Tax=Desulfatitalea alkaliphila TaxID=2929485 RepID=A0AA41R3Q4_9BACT|nr:methylenetetrahydrofolate reductase [Desulfatitalea alkaliphila]MCJ8500793.1 methylenetetrahydrofolate reductase [Desulfatitalea alkaliphila]
MSFQKRLTSGEFVVLAEMNTPKGVDISQLMTNARRIKGRVDAAVVPDMDNGVMRMSAMAGGVLMQQQGLEAIIHLYCRDRNRMALQGDILAAHVLGIQNLVVVNSESMANSDHREAKAVDDLDEVSLLEAIRSLQQGKDLAGFELEGTPTFTTGCTVGAFADDQQMAAELELTRRKVAAGAQYIVTPPVFDVDRCMPFLNAAADLGVPIIATIFLIKSVGIARYMALNEPGAHISEEMIRRIRKAPDRETECLKIAGETIGALKDKVAGVKIETHGWEHRLASILDYAGL